MITRTHIRRWLAWTGVGIGFLGLLGYLFSFFTAVTHTWGSDRTIVVGRGGVSVFWTFTDTSAFFVAGSFPYVGQSPHWRWLPTFTSWPDSMNPQVTIHCAIIPFWVPVLIGALCAYRLLPAAYPVGRCGKCGYDLQGVREEGGVVQCPECGTAGAAGRG